MNTNLPYTETTLIQNCLKEDRKSQKKLYDTFAPKLFSVCIKYMKNHMDAEDVLQEGFVKLFNHLHKFKGEGSFEGWMRRIFVNTAIEHIRRRKMESGGYIEIFENSILDKRPSALDNLYNEDLLHTTNSLSRGYRTVFHLYAIEGYSHKEIAARLNITESTSKSQYLRAKATLRSVIERKQSA